MAPRGLIDPIATRWRDALLETVEPHLGIPLLLSGGMDSKTLLAARVSLGDIPHCYTLRIGDKDSPDLLGAREAARAVGVELTEVVMDPSPEALVRDVKEVIRIIQRSGKAAIQCAHPILLIAREVARDGHDRAMTGLGGIIAEDNRKCQIAAREAQKTGDWSVVESMRVLGSNDSEDPKSATWAMHQAALHCGVKLVDPYGIDPVREVALSIPYYEMNTPKQKGIALRAFPEFYSSVSWKQNSALQIGGGVREFHDTLLETEYNARGMVRVIGIYNDFAKEIL